MLADNRNNQSMEGYKVEKMFWSSMSFSPLFQDEEDLLDGNFIKCNN